MTSGEWDQTLEFQLISRSRMIRLRPQGNQTQRRREMKTLKITQLSV